MIEITGSVRKVVPTKVWSMLTPRPLQPITKTEAIVPMMVSYTSGLLLRQHQQA